MKMLQKIIDRKSLESSQENVCDKVYFSKVASLHFTGCNSTINKLHHRLFSEYVSKSYCLEKNFLRKNLWCTSFLKSCGPVAHSR